MKGSEAAAALRRLADAIEQFEYIPKPGRETFPEALQLGAAAMIMLLRDLYTASPKDVFRREDILVVLNELQHDPDMFTMDLVTLMDDGS